MIRPKHLTGALALALFGAACSTTAPTDSERSFGFSNFEQPTAEPSWGAALSVKPDTTVRFADDVDGDVRGRTENYFDASSTPDTGGTDNESGSAPREPNAEPTTNRADRKMVYSASFSVMVSTLPEAIQKLIERAEALGGYLARRQDSTLTVRVPAKEFQTLAVEIPSYGRVLSESMSANDVTSRHTDLSIRLENAEKSRKRLLALLDKATKMEDVIKIESALRRLTSEIEQMKGQLKLLNNQIAFSTLTVTFQANAAQAKPARKQQRSRFGWINRIGIEQDLRRF